MIFALVVFLDFFFDVFFAFRFPSLLVFLGAVMDFRGGRILSTVVPGWDFTASGPFLRAWSLVFSMVFLVGLGVLFSGWTGGGGDFTAGEILGSAGDAFKRLAAVWPGTLSKNFVCLKRAALALCGLLGASLLRRAVEALPIIFMLRGSLEALDSTTEPLLSTTVAALSRWTITSKMVPLGVIVSVGVFTW